MNTARYVLVSPHSLEAQSYFKSVHCVTQQVADDGGLELATAILSEEEQSKPVIVETLKLLKTLAGNDNVKNDVRTGGIFQLLVSTMSKHMVRLTQQSFEKIHQPIPHGIILVAALQKAYGSEAIFVIYTNTVALFQSCT